MRNRVAYIFLIGVLLAASCNKLEDAFVVDEIEGGKNIELQCVFENNHRSSYSSGEISTKSLINQTSSTDDILCNFLRLDSEEAPWTEAYLSEGTIATLPGAIGGLRSVSLHPAQPYNTGDQYATSKMVGWYPKTDDNNDDVTIQYKSFTSTYIVRNDQTCVKFTGLDGSIDLMLSDVKEGSFKKPFDDKNYFTFKHYLSAIRVYAQAEKSAQDIGLWKEINEVVIRRQPTSCIVSLPSSVGSFGKVVEWGNEEAKFKIHKTHLFGENDADYPGNVVAEQYPVKLDGSDVEKYLGYSLIKPKQDLTIQVHTGSGVYDVVIPCKYGDSQADIFNPGYIYDIHLNFKTDGTVFAFIEKDGDERYFDLSAGQEYNNEDHTVYDYKNANCYIINSGPYTPSTPYDGFCFDATIVGNGDGGIITTGAQTFYPQNAHIEPYSAEVLWETSPRLVSQIELLYGYVRFKVAKESETTYKEGNAVIAVYDKDHNILWSWHIWITDTPQDITYTEGSTSITIMDRNLGAVYGSIPENPEDALASYGLYYQWGRKDPSMGPPTYDYSPINMTTAPYYDYSSEMKDAAEVVRFAMPTLQDAVENPMFLIMPTMLTQTYSFNWLYEKIDFLWGYSKTTGYTHKTIYDPCPFGYRVSGGELADLFTYASTDGSIITSNAYGQVVNVPEESNSSEQVSIFFPYSGYKGVDRGLNSLISSWKYVGQKGDYQSSIVSMYTGDDEYYMHRSRIYLSKDRTWNELNVGDYTGHQIQDHTNRRTAAPVRCVKNDRHKHLMAFITPHKYIITGARDTVKFTLYAYAIESSITSATLSIGYHLKSNPEEHKESIIASWPSIGTAIWQPEVIDYAFRNINNTVDINSTTGEFRFILTVKSADNINKMSSTTIRLAKNYVEYLNWEDEETLFANTPIDKRFRIYGDSKPITVEIWQKGSGGGTDTSLLPVTDNLQQNSDSEYPYDYNCSTQGLEFDNEGTYDVYLKITLENGQEIITEPKKFIIKQAQWVEVTDIDDITSTGVYLIMNVMSDGFAYDNGNQLGAKAKSDESCYFSFEKKDSNYLIKNNSTGNYANISGYSLYISANNTSSASEFVLQYNKTGKYFKIGTKLRQNHTYYYYWRQIEGANNITIAYGDSDVMQWKIYKQNIP